jgi:cell division protein FtsL
MTHKLIQAYRQTPWRVQLQRLGFIALAILMVLLVAAIYLNISAQAASAGLDFQKLEYEREDLQREIANLDATLGSISSEQSMMDRAQKMGFKPLTMDKAVYVVVPGFAGHQTVTFAPAPSSDMLADPIIKPSYTQSLWEWLFQGVLTWTNAAGGTN